MDYYSSGCVSSTALINVTKASELLYKSSNEYVGYSPSIGLGGYIEYSPNIGLNGIIVTATKELTFFEKLEKEIKDWCGGILSELN